MKKVFFSLAILVLFVNFVAAVDTELTVKTVPEMRVDISILRPGYIYSLIESFHETSDASGEIKVTFSHNQDDFKVKVWLKEDNEVFMSESFEEEYPTGEALTLEMYPKWYSPPETEDLVLNETNSSGETQEQNTTEQEIIIGESDKVESSKQTGSVIFGEEGIVTKKRIYYILGGILLLVGLFFGSRLLLKHKGEGREIKVRKMSEFQAETKEKAERKEESDREGDNRLANAEKKLKEAQEEINLLKNQDRIKELENKIEEDKDRLERLRKEKE
ncbi:MAG TPA: hypothetical protein ENH46_05840 [Candidatus Pacearchaeota archaeon]|nr:hypothetical protein [Candidatus Pacearchaeota archaeon]